MINQYSPENVAGEKESTRRKLLAVVCAFGLTALVFAGYAYIRRFHAAKVLASISEPALVTSGPKGPPLVHILINEPTLEKSTSTFGGSVTNISERPLSGLSVALELHRKDGTVDQSLVSVEPGNLQPKQEGVYAIKLPVQTYVSIKLVGLKSESESSLIAYSSGLGKKRAPERIEPKVIVVKRGAKPGEFLNTPDNPGRLP